MIKVTAAKRKVQCVTCGQDTAVVLINLGDPATEGGYHLCRACADKLLERLQRREALAHAK